MCCKCKQNCWNYCNNANWTDNIPTRRILVTDLDALLNRSGSCGCGCGCGCNTGCGCTNSCDCDDTASAVIGTGNAACGCGNVSLFGCAGSEGIEFANVFNNRCSCCN